MLAWGAAFGAVSRIARAIKSVATPSEFRRLMGHRHQFFFSITGEIAARMPRRPDITLVWPLAELQAALKEEP
jgi:hypothetical protein